MSARHILQCRPYFKRRDGNSYRVRPRTAGSSAYYPAQIAEAYGLPPGLTGSGIRIGIIELGGAFNTADFASYMKTLELTPPAVAVVPVNNAKIVSDPGGADVEVMLDVEIAAALAPASDIRVYFADNTTAGFAAAIRQAVAEQCNVVSISWGGPEQSWTTADRQEMEAALALGAKAGCSIYAAAGDNGASDGAAGLNVDYPASSQYVIACGGTSLVIENKQIVSETVWNDGSQGGATGGGFSIYYAKPAYQPANHTSMRGVPDVCGNADPETGWMIMVGGQMQSVGGTSAVAPMWAAIDALWRQQNQKSYTVAHLYANPGAFRDTVSGNNGFYQAGPGWDACTGLGSPRGAVLFATLAEPPPVPPPAAPLPPESPAFLAQLDQAGNVLAKIPWRGVYSLLFSLFSRES